MEKDHVPAAISYITIGIALYVVGELMFDNQDPFTQASNIGAFVAFVGRVTLAVGVLVSASKWFR